MDFETTPMSPLSRLRMLVACMRDALHDRSPPTGADEPPWPLLYRTACEQGVDTFLFPWLDRPFP